ncbi:hypothetical protein GW930_03110 [Candidatus Saccharibacteria bacterium]|nr:hypothetical protein [Candidatus Saccharibacteria bacterium]
MVRQRKLWIIVGSVLLVAVVAVALVYSLSQRSDTNNNESEAKTATMSVYEGAAPQVIDTSDALSRYVSNKKAGVVQESDLYLPADVDWNEEVLVAVQFDALQAKAFRGITREVVDGEESYIIELLGAAEGCSTVQINTVRIAFIVQSTSQDTSLPVIIRTVPNTASCEL